MTKGKKKKKSIKCYFCSGPHEVRYCPIEKKKSAGMKKEVGKFMENYYAENYMCMRCGSSNKNHVFINTNFKSKTCNHNILVNDNCCINRQLKVLNDRTPSLDIVCNGCGNRIEIKSKCLSVKHLPNDLILPHGSFSHYEKRQENGLDFVIIIYGIKRQTKQIFVREILYFKNEIITNSKDIIKISKQNKSQLSKIYIPDRLHPNIINLPLPKKKVIEFRERVDRIPLV